MDTYWDGFINKYGSWLVDIPLRTILMIFWEYCQNPQEDMTQRFINITTIKE